MNVNYKRILFVLKYFLMSSLLFFVWLNLIMVHFDWFFPPFTKLKFFLTPWAVYEAIPEEATVEDRISALQKQLDKSTKMTNYSLIALLISFSLLCVYLTILYQQRQRRIRENRLLILKNNEIARRNEFIRYISATIGHEFKNNLGRIKRRLALIEELPKEIIEKIDDNFNKLFADIEIFKKISDERESGLMQFNKVDLKDMLLTLSKQYNDFAETDFKNDNIKIPYIFASGVLLKTVFENLFDNSIKYKKPDQKKAIIHLEFSIEIDSRRRYVSLFFRDEGIGMSEQEADQCFYKHRGLHEGWGQGLYFAKYVIGLHAGKIKVGKDYTAPNKGTEIIISFPFVEEEINV
jgi:signal transduction histidine kinase